MDVSILITHVNCIEFLENIFLQNLLEKGLFQSHHTIYSGRSLQCRRKTLLGILFISTLCTQIELLLSVYFYREYNIEGEEGSIESLQNWNVKATQASFFSRYSFLTPL